MINIEQVERTWDILNRATKPLTYGDLARKLGYTKRQRAGFTVWKYLWVVGEYCTRKGWPCLNALVDLVTNQLLYAPAGAAVPTCGRLSLLRAGGGRSA